MPVNAWGIPRALAFTHLKHLFIHIIPSSTPSPKIQKSDVCLSNSILLTKRISTAVSPCYLQILQNRTSIIKLLPFFEHSILEQMLRSTALQFPSFKTSMKWVKTNQRTFVVPLLRIPRSGWRKELICSINDVLISPYSGKRLDSKQDGHLWE